MMAPRMTSTPAALWRLLFVVGGVIYFAGAFFHPRGMTMSEMLVDPWWIPSHAAVFLGVALLTMGLASFRKSVRYSAALQRWLVATLGLAVLQVIEMGLHTMAYVDAGALPHGAFHAGLSTPVLSAHIWIATLSFTPFAIAFLGLIWRGMREQVLGSPWILWIGAIGGVAYAIVMPLVFLFEIADAGILFPVAHLLVPLWFILAGVWPSRHSLSRE